ncbi:hypothetical protein T10_5260 [Trichinella papuae]|uniref:Uncharacterized protein n=1 Tax=Trichinella papuae TaxID=268474 RepID=A0A0V1M299_9BILA|nr:hypothetical protein T10_5260 [Trichinella papuae]
MTLDIFQTVEDCLTIRNKYLQMTPQTVPKADAREQSDKIRATSPQRPFTSNASSRMVKLQQSLFLSNQNHPSKVGCSIRGVGISRMQKITIIEDEQAKLKNAVSSSKPSLVRSSSPLLCSLQLLLTTTFSSMLANLYRARGVSRANHGPNSSIPDACSSTTVYIDGQKRGSHVACRVV